GVDGAPFVGAEPPSARSAGTIATATTTTPNAAATGSRADLTISVFPGQTSPETSEMPGVCRPPRAGIATVIPQGGRPAGGFPTVTEREPNENSAFLAGLSHDLRTPLNSLLVLAELLAENPDGNLTEKQIEFARTILSSGNQLLDLADIVRDRSLDGGARASASEAAVLLRSAVFDDDREGLTPGDGVVLIVEDDASFAQLLLETARSSGLKGVVAGRGDTGLALAHACRPDAIVLDLGLPVLDGPDLIERLRAHPATRAIPIHVITGASGATPDRDVVASVLEKPVALEDLTALFDGIVSDAADRGTEESDDEEGIAPESDAAGVLIVDDRPETLHAMAAVLEPLDCRIVTAGSGREALRRLLTQQFAVVLLDVQMPGMDGL